MMNIDALCRLSDIQLYQFFSEYPIKWVSCFIPVEKQEHIVRCTKLKDENGEVFSISRLSYCPSPLLADNVYNRCNLPKQEMFYGTLYGEEDDEIQHALITSVFEVSNLCHETSEEDEFYLSGIWRATRDITTIIIFDNNQPAKNTFFNRAKQRAELFLAEHPNEDLGDMTLVEAFSRDVKENIDYRITAVYSDFLFKRFPIDAIVYPSVRTGKVGTCIAIRPSFVDSGGIELVSTSKYRLYSEGEKSVRGVICQHGSIDMQAGKINYVKI